MELDSRQRQYLKGLAHHLKPIVHLGKEGLTPSLLKQIDEALLQHELIKVKLGESSPLDRKAAATELPARTGAAFVQNIGRVFVLYREHPEEPTIDLPFPRRLETPEEEGEGEGAGITFGPSVRQRGPTPAPVSPAVRERPERDGAAAKPRAGGRAKAKPRPKHSKPPRKKSRGTSRR